MRWQALFLLLLCLQVAQNERVLFEQGFVKFVRQGKRELYHNVTHIDGKIVPSDKELVLVKSKYLEVLHPQAVRNLRNLKYLYLSKCAIKRIEERAFYKLPNLTVLHLEDNRLAEIKKNVFNGLSLQMVSLHRNEIKQIHSEAFDDMPNLVRIKLNKNKLKFWDSGWFKRVPKLTDLYFRRNQINFLPEKAFVNFANNEKVNIFLSKNKLGELFPQSFYGLEKIGQLFLDRNGIQNIPDGLFRDLRQTDLIYLARNKITKVGKAFPKVVSIGNLDLSSNLLQCLPYELVIIVNVTNLEKNNRTCSCITEFKKKIAAEKRYNEIVYDPEDC